jgi:hypothetical protein
MKSGDPVILEGLKRNTARDGAHVLYWNEAEFQPIMDAFDKLFANPQSK